MHRIHFHKVSLMVISNPNFTNLYAYFPLDQEVQNGKEGVIIIRDFLVVL